MGTIARESGTVVSAVMLGAIAGSGLFPFRREDYETVVRGGDTMFASSSRPMPSRKLTRPMRSIISQVR